MADFIGGLVALAIVAAIIGGLLYLAGFALGLGLVAAGL